MCQYNTGNDFSSSFEQEDLHDPRGSSSQGLEFKYIYDQINYIISKWQFRFPYTYTED